MFHRIVIQLSDGVSWGLVVHVLLEWKAGGESVQKEADLQLGDLQRGSQLSLTASQRQFVRDLCHQARCKESTSIYHHANKGRPHAALEFSVKLV